MKLMKFEHLMMLYACVTYSSTDNSSYFELFKFIDDVVDDGCCCCCCDVSGNGDGG